MPQYTVKVFTSYSSGVTIKWLSIKLVGKDGTSDWMCLTGLRNFFNGGESTIYVDCAKPLGNLIAIKLQKSQLLPYFDLQWFVDKVEVTLDMKVFKFPIYHWIKRTKEYAFYEGTALRAKKPLDMLDEPKVPHPRECELSRRAEKYKWKEYKKDLPHCMDCTGNCIFSLPSEVQFSLRKLTDFGITAVSQQVKQPLFSRCKAETWENLDVAIYKELKHHMSDRSEYVRKKWKEDAFFGYQFLNGVNPMKIQRCTCLPSNFPVTDDMLTLEGDKTLSEELENENIFICDYKTLDGVETGRKKVVSGLGNVTFLEYIAAALVLFHKTPAGELKPVAIQLKQTPGEDNPIFVPTDSEYDWLLAKTFVRSADFAEHQLNTHLLRTHLLSEVFTVSLLRNVPKVHPLHKLLIPHTRYTLQINLLARDFLINKSGVFPTFSASTEEGMTTILQRSMSRVTYKSLCIKENIKERGMESVPNYYYKEDGIELWDIIEKFVKGVLSYYYENNEQIKEDHELQRYIKEIFEHGFLSKESSGIPQRFESVDELVTFATMVIFTASAQHAAVNNGQYDYGTWMPNTPTTLMRAPPTTKGEATEETMLKTLPRRTVTHKAVEVLYLLSKPSPDFVPLGKFPYEHFTEMVPRHRMDEFYYDLTKLNDKIDERNKKLDLPYIYLKPSLMENSVAI